MTKRSTAPKNTSYIVVLVVSLLAIYLFPSAHADTFNASAEAETGTLAGPATANSNVAAASGDGSVTFAAAGGSADACVIDPSEKLLDQDTTDSQSPWKRPKGEKMVIHFSTEGVPADWAAEMEKGVIAWNHSPCLNISTVPNCQGVSNCVPVKVGDGGGDDGNFNDIVKGGYTTGGDIEYLSTLKGLEKTNVTIHEMGHAVGLRHRKTKNVLMNGDTNNVIEPDDTDYHNLLVEYANQK